MKQTALYNGKVYEARGRFAQAILIEDGMIRLVGSNEDILLAAGPNCERIDCEGRTVLPGLNDSHCHLLQVGEGMCEVNTADCTSVEDLVERCQLYLQTHPQAAVKGLHSIGWNQELFAGKKRVPTRYDLDRISTEIPIVLERICGLVVSANTYVVRKLGLTASSPAYEGGAFLLGEDGTPNGVFTENACQFAVGVLPGYTLSEHAGMMERAIDYAAAHGITSVQSNDVGCSTHDYAHGFALLHRLYDEQEQKIRYRHQVGFFTPADFRESLEHGEYRYGFYPPAGKLQLGPLKLFKDGSLGARTAAMRSEYLDDPGNHGVFSIDDDTMDEYCRLAAGAGIQIVTHTIGDAAIEHTVAAYERILPTAGNPLRHGLIHCQITDRPLLERIARDQLLAFYQPIFLNFDLHAVVSRCGSALSSTSYAFHTLDALGGSFSYGTDSPVEDLNPFPNIYSAVTRQDLSGFPRDGFYPQEGVDVFTAVDAYTWRSAYAEFQEGHKGRIRSGYVADLTVLDQDIFTCDPSEIKNILPVLTMMGGDITYRA